MNDPIKLRWKKLDDGKESAFLDITLPGQKRKKEYLKIYRGGPIKKRESKEAERLALAICEKRLSEYNASRAGLEVPKSHRLLIPFFEEVTALKENKDTRKNWRSAMLHMQDYMRRNGIDEGDYTLSDVTKDFCQGFVDYLVTEARPLTIKYDSVCTGHFKRKPITRFGMEPSTAREHFIKFRALLNEAVRRNMILVNPSNGVVLPKVVEKHKSYLDVEEVKLLMRTPFEKDNLRRAFLFSCFTGMRFSDINAMRWENVKRYNNNWRIDFSQRKTSGIMYLDISDMAFEYLGVPGNPGDSVFGLPIPFTCNRYLSRWTRTAGITKHITFHSARHTAAVSLLTSGAEIFTVSKILGHASLRSTMVYSQIVDSKRKEAVDNLANLFAGGTAEGQK